MYWYWVRLTRSSTVMFCTGCMNNLMPFTWARLEFRRRITSEALRSRWFSGFKLIDMRPLFSVVLVPSAPMKDEMLSTAGS